jgi:hypothetical protein
LVSLSAVLFSSTEGCLASLNLGLICPARSRSEAVRRYCSIFATRSVKRFTDLIVRPFVQELPELGKIKQGLLDTAHRNHLGIEHTFCIITLTESTGSRSITLQVRHSRVDGTFAFLWVSLDNMGSTVFDMRDRLLGLFDVLSLLDCCRPFSDLFGNPYSS